MISFFEITNVKFNHINVREYLPNGNIVYKAKVGDVLKGNYDNAGNFILEEINNKKLKGVISKNANYETKEIKVEEDDIYIYFTLCIDDFIIDWNGNVTKEELKKINELKKVISNSKIYKAGEAIK